MNPLEVFEHPKDHDTAVPTRLGTQLDYILLDGSSSMHSKWWDSLVAVESYVKAIRDGNVNTRIIVKQFAGGDLDCLCRDTFIGQWESLIDKPFGILGGGTPLYDAIQIMGREMQKLDPPRASAVIITDGEEAGSRFTTVDQAKAILDWMRAKGWQVTFIGANFNNSKQAGLLGGQKGTMIGVSTARLTDAAAALGKKRANYGLYGTDMHYTDDEQQRFGGFLSGPSSNG